MCLDRCWRQTQLQSKLAETVWPISAVFGVASSPVRDRGACRLSS